MIDPPITPVILSGGSGTRLWPLSRQAWPKQLLPLAGENSMLQETVARVRGEGFSAPLVIGNQEHRFQVVEHLRAMGVRDARILLEPAGRNTAPAAAVAAIKVAQSHPDGLVLLMPSDHAVQDRIAFQKAVATARQAADTGALVTFGITPSAPRTGYGYIRRGTPVPNVPGAFAIDRFIEKPDHATATSYLAAGGYFWNSGMFLFRASVFLDELARLQPRILACCRDALAQARSDGDFIRLDEAAFSACPSLSIDYAVMEHASRAVVVPVEMGWSDVGTWQSLWEIAPHDSDGNALRGEVLVEKTSNSYLRSEGPLVAAVGVEDLVVIATRDAVLVSRRDASQDVRGIVSQLEGRSSGHHLQHAVVHRPWGSYESVATGPGFQVKRIMVKPGAMLSLQTHDKRSEHWVVVAGKAMVTCGERRFPLRVNESVFIPLGARHRLENPGDEILVVIEVQSGAYLGEDDIVRFEDAYGRSGEKPYNDC